MPSAEQALAARAATTAQILVDDLEHPQLGEDDQHHLVKVLRIRDGERVAITNGRGGWRLCSWQGSLQPSGEVEYEPQGRNTQIAFALTKGDKPELVVQKLTEIGIARIVPFVSARSIVRWDAAKAEKHVERFRRVAREAAMQCRRVWLPDIAAVATYAEILSQQFAIAAPGGDAAPQTVDKIAVGPEGGWSDAELTEARTRVSLGHTILRAETAAIVAAAHVQGYA
jgi:16S rRNA (uracil1498-N3)-methyltransferase